MTRKKTAWKKGDPLVVELLNQVRIKATGSKDAAMSQGDFSALSEDISEKNKTTIDDRTLKEYLGYYQSRTDGCSLNILNAFAVYLGFKNFYAFKKEEENKIKTDENENPPSNLQEIHKAEGTIKTGKNNYRTFLLIAIAVIISGLLLLILLNQKSIKAPEKEAGRIETPEKTTEDSIPSEIAKKEPKTIMEEEAKTISLPETEKAQPEFDIAGYLNGLNAKFDMALLIVDENKQPENELSSRIANFYRKQNYSVTYSLFTTKFIQSQYFYDLQNANSQVINMLKLDSLINTAILGEITYTFRDGTLEAGTIICHAKISMNIISANQKSLINSFSVSANGNGVSDAQAKENAILILLNKLNEEYSPL